MDFEAEDKIFSENESKEFMEAQLQAAVLNDVSNQSEPTILLHSSNNNFVPAAVRILEADFAVPPSNLTMTEESMLIPGSEQISEFISCDDDLSNSNERNDTGTTMAEMDHVRDTVTERESNPCTESPDTDNPDEADAEQIYRLMEIFCQYSSERGTTSPHEPFSRETLERLVADGLQWAEAQRVGCRAAEERLAREQAATLAQVERAEAAILRAWQNAQATVDNEYNELMQVTMNAMNGRVADIESRRAHAQRMLRNLEVAGGDASDEIDPSDEDAILRGSAELTMPPLQAVLEFIPAAPIAPGVNLLGTLSIVETDEQ